MSWRGELHSNGAVGQWRRKAEVANLLSRDLENGDIHNYFGARLVEIADDLLGECNLIRSTADHQRILGGNGLHACDVQNGAKSVGDVLKLGLTGGVGEVERLDYALVEILALGLRVCCHKDRIWGYWPPKCPRLDGYQAEGLLQRDTV